MSLFVNWKGVNIYQPGAYWGMQTLSSADNTVTPTGVVAIIGESDQGLPGSESGLVSFTPDQVSGIQSWFGDGRLSVAAGIVAKPANDPAIPNGVQKVLVWKTNASTRATAKIKSFDASAVDAFDVKSVNAGIWENSNNFYISQGVLNADRNAVVVSDAITFPLTISDNDDLVLDVNGTNYTLAVDVTGTATSISLSQAQVVTLLNGTAVTVGTVTATPTWTASKPVIAAAVSTDKVSLTLDPTVLTAVSAQFEYAVLSVETSLLKTALALTTASTVSNSTLVVTEGSAGPVRGLKGGRIVTINKSDVVENIPENANADWLSIYYIGAASACTMTISGATDDAKTLATTCTGVAADDLSLRLNQFKTVADLVSYINTFGGGAKYVCVSSYNKRNVMAPKYLDRYTSINIKTLPLKVKGAMYEIEQGVNAASTLIQIERKAVIGTLELIAAAARRYLSGAVKGGSSNADFAAGLAALMEQQCNYVTVLISQDAADDIDLGETDIASTYDLISVNAAVASHVIEASKIKNRKPRRAYTSFLGTFAESKEYALNHGTARVSTVFQNATVLDTTDTAVEMQPWATACVAMGMDGAKAVGTSLTHKFANVVAISHPDFKQSRDMDDALASNLFVFESFGGGYRVVVHNTTYNQDQNECWNRGNVIDIGDYCSYDLATAMETNFVGGERGDSASLMLSQLLFATNRLNSYKQSGLLVGDKLNGGKGWRNLSIYISGAKTYLKVVLTPEPSVEFILMDIGISMPQDAA